MSKFLLLYGTKEGQTKKIAEAIAERFYEAGNSVDLFDTATVPHDINFGIYDGIIAGAPIHVSKYPRSFRKFIAKCWHMELVPSAFFTVCMGVLEHKPEVDADLKRIQEKFFVETRWLPARRTVFAGALKYTKYNWLVKFVIKRIAKKAGSSTDTTRDHEYTDWKQVRQFADEFISHLPHVREKTASL